MKKKNIWNKSFHNTEVQATKKNGFINIKVNFRQVNCKKKDGNFLMIKRLIHQEDIRTLNAYAPNNWYQNKDSKPIELQRKMDNIKIYLEDLTLFQLLVE